MSAAERIQQAYPRIWHRAHRHTGRQSALSERDQRLLGHLSRTRAWPVAALAEHLAVAPSTLSEHLHDLIARGLVVRDTDPEDRRRATVRLTDAGREARFEDGPLDPGRLERAVSRLGADAEAVAAALEALATALEEEP